MDSMLALIIVFVLRKNYKFYRKDAKLFFSHSALSRQELIFVLCFAT